MGRVRGQVCIRDDRDLGWFRAKGATPYKHCNADLSDSAAFCAALRVTLAKSAEEQKMFDKHFASYWQVWDRATELNRRRRADEETTAVVVDKRTPARAATATISDWLKGGEKAEEAGDAAGPGPYTHLTLPTGDLS